MLHPLKRLASIETYKPGKPIEEVRRELGLRDVIKLASNENPLGPSPKALEALRKNLSLLNRYPEGSSPRLRNALSRHWNLGPEHFIFGNGSNEILIFAAQAFCEVGQSIAYSARSFAVYEIAAKLAGARILEAPSPDFCHDLSALAALSRKAQVLFLCNPNNPTGSWHDPKALEAFLDRASRSCLLVLDEAYAEFSGQTELRSKAWLLKYPNLLICRTFSKIYGLAGLRIGYGVANPQIISALEKCRQPFNVNLLAQAAGEAALKDRSFVRQTLSNNSRGLRLIEGLFKKKQIWHMPSKANFVFFRQPKDGLFDFMLRRGIILRPISGPYLRVTIGRPEEDRRFVEALEAFLR